MDFKKDLEKNEKTSENEALSGDALDAVSGGWGVDVKSTVTNNSNNQTGNTTTTNNNNQNTEFKDINTGGGAFNLDLRRMSGANSD